MYRQITFPLMHQFAVNDLRQQFQFLLLTLSILCEVHESQKVTKST